jgi:hypothetical protein
MNFDSLVIGKEYDRPTLARLWGYESFHAISRGVITPKGKNLIILFVTKDNQETLTQYEDHIEQDILFWEGEKGHGSDQRIISRQDIIHVFYREVHHSDFKYEGRADLRGYKLLEDRPSKFTFQLIDRLVNPIDIIEEIKSTYTLSQTEKDAIIKSRRGQGIYRTNSIKLWKTCSVTGFSKSNVLIASHIKPWKVSVNAERIDHYNSLLLVPTLDKLFDKGYIGFEPNGKILISEKISDIDLKRIGISSDLKLRQVPEETRNYLHYHCEYRFDILNE